MGWNTLVQAETLAIALGRADLVIVDCRYSSSSPGAGEDAYEHSHLPGAVYAHLDRDLSDMSQRGQGNGRHPWPDARTFTARLGHWGILPHHQVVAYDDADGAMAARFWFLMRALGHEKVAVLDGGFARWTGAGLCRSNSDIVSAGPRSYVANFDRSRLLDAGTGAGTARRAANCWLDARPADRFRGENEPHRSRGRPCARCAQPSVCGQPASKAASSRRRNWQTNSARCSKVASPDQAIMMCGSGVTACHHLLAMERAGLAGARLYTGSWSGWIEDPQRPIATG